MNLQRFHTNHVESNCTWPHCIFPAKMAGRIYLSHQLWTLHPPLIIQYVKGCIDTVFYMRLRGCRVFCAIFCVFPFEIQPIITLEGSISYTFHKEGKNKVTVQVASGSTVMQDSKVITVKGEWGRQSSMHFNWCYARNMNMQCAISGKV